MNVKYTRADMMAVAMARLIADRERVFVGVNSPLPMVAVTLALKLHATHADFITIAGGINAQPPALAAATSSARLSAGSASVFDNEDFYGLNARGGVDVSFLGMAQIDAQANVNSSFIGGQTKPKVRFPGGGGAAVILPLTRRIILWRAAHSPRIFVERCEFVTSAGNIDRVVTPLCVFRKRDGRLALESIHPYVARDALQQQTGFMIPGLDQAPLTPEPDARELEMLVRIDPDSVRESEFRPADLAIA
ncbi:MAG TPA: CoA-transferase [Burkholderiales bacterium]|nr:CoA-transferase [Burkholderiales bacterium]